MKKLLIFVATALVMCVPAFAENEAVYFVDSCVANLINGSSYSFLPSTDVYYYVKGDMPADIYGISVVDGAIAHFQRTDTNPAIDYNRICNNLVDSSAYNVLCLSVNSPFTPVGFPTTIPANWTDSDIESAFLSFVDSIPSGSVSSSFTLPRGNVLYFQVDSAQDVKLTSYMDSLSNIINFNSATFGPWGDTGQRFGPAAALPTSGTTFPLASQSPIHWNKDASQNVLGQTKIGRKNVSCIASQWYCFYNPNANHIEGADPYNALPGASVVFEGSFSQIKVYPVNQKLSVVDGDLYSGSNDDFESYYDGTVDEDGTVTWTNQDGNIGAPAAGGQNFEDGPKSATSLLEGIRVTLETVVHELQTLFTFGYSAIQSLVGIMSDFVSVFSGLYTWLPAEVYSALMSAVVVAIVIGVFKVFL